MALFVNLLAAGDPPTDDQLAAAANELDELDDATKRLLVATTLTADGNSSAGASLIGSTSIATLSPTCSGPPDPLFA